jgi:hypothetical protein
MANDDPTTARAAEVQAAGAARYGDHWVEFIRSIGATRQVSADTIKQMIASDDAVENISLLGRQSLLLEMQGDHNDTRVRHAEDVYASLRERDRENHAFQRGRARR